MFDSELCYMLGMTMSAIHSFEAAYDHGQRMVDANVISQNDYYEHHDWHRRYISRLTEPAEEYLLTRIEQYDDT